MKIAREKIQKKTQKKKKNGRAINFARLNARPAVVRGKSEARDIKRNYICLKKKPQTKIGKIAYCLTLGSLPTI